MTEKMSKIKIPNSSPHSGRKIINMVDYILIPCIEIDYLLKLKRVY